MRMTAPRVRRRKTIAALASSALLLTGCGTDVSGSADGGAESFVFTPGDEVVEIEYWSAAVEDLNTTLIEDFNEGPGTELGIHVNISYQGEYAEQQQKLYAAQLADTLPNLFVSEASSTAALVDAELAVPLDPYIEANDLDVEDFEIGEIGYLFSGEEQYALPYMRSVPVMYVNRGVLEKYGFDPSGPKTLEELGEVLRTVSAGQGAPAMPFLMTTWFIEPLLYSFADLPINAEDGSSNIADRKAVELVEWLRDLIDDGAIKLIPRGQTQDLIASLVAPTTAVSFYTSAGITGLQKTAPERGVDLGVALFPSGEDGSRGVAVGGSNLYIADTGTVQQKAAAFELARWLTEAEQAAANSAATGYIAVRESARDTETLQSVFSTNPAFGVASEQMTYARSRVLSPNNVEVDALVGERLDQLVTQDQDAADALSALAEELDAISSR